MKKEVNHLLDVFNNFSVIFFNQLPFIRPCHFCLKQKGYCSVTNTSPNSPLIKSFS